MHVTNTKTVNWSNKLSIHKVATHLNVPSFHFGTLFPFPKCQYRYNKQTELKKLKVVNENQTKLSQFIISKIIGAAVCRKNVQFVVLWRYRKWTKLCTILLMHSDSNINPFTVYFQTTLRNTELH